MTSSLFRTIIGTSYVCSAPAGGGGGGGGVGGGVEARCGGSWGEWEEDGW